MRLVTSSAYPDVALSVYVKVKALGARPEGCEAKAGTVASYLGVSKASVERGLKALSRPAPDGVVELMTYRRTLPGGRGTSAVRHTRPMGRTEAFVWLPVAASEDLTPRQLRAYTVIAFSEQMGIALTEHELAGHLLHHSGRKAGQPITVAAAGAVVDGLEAVKWVTVHRRAGAQGRHRFLVHDIAPTAAGSGVTPVVDPVPEPVQECPQEPVDNTVAPSVSSLVDEGSGPLVGEGSLANKEVPMTDSPDDESAISSPAVGEVPVVEAVENPADTTARTDAPGRLALRADDNSQPVLSKPKDEKRSDGGGSLRSAYTGPQLTITPDIYAVLEPVHSLLKRVNNPFVERKIAREVGQQLKAGMTRERLYHRLTARFAGVMASEIRDPGRWLLGVALPRWGCGHLACESGAMWPSGRPCDVCAEVVARRAAARRRTERLEQGLCPYHGTTPGPTGTCTDCELQEAINTGGTVPERRAPKGPPRGSCSECGCRIFLTGHALKDGLCKPCRTELRGRTGKATPAVAQPVRSDNWSKHLAQLASRPLSEGLVS
ncbi:hypothetical protein [Streptomyces niveus]|uniref:hypothetical protein n=1 Tax=Streptomyces niveus TaxID=193462 RepID=UPI0036D2CFC5